MSLIQQLKELREAPTTNKEYWDKRDGVFVLLPQIIAQLEAGDELARCVELTIKSMQSGIHNEIDSQLILQRKLDLYKESMESI